MSHRTIKIEVAEVDHGSETATATASQSAISPCRIRSMIFENRDSVIAQGRGRLASRSMISLISLAPLCWSPAHAIECPLLIPRNKSRDFRQHRQHRLHMMFILGEWLDRLKAVCCEQSIAASQCRRRLQIATTSGTTITAYSAAIQGGPELAGFRRCGITSR